MSPFTENIKKFLPYFEELQRRLYLSTILFSVVFVVGFLSTSFVLKYFIKLFDIRDVVIAATSPFQFADISIDVGFFFAILITLPFLLVHVYIFLAQALTKKEKKIFFLLIPVSLGLFLLGFAYGFLILYYSFTLLAQVNEGLGIKNIWDIATFLSQIFITASLLGVIFEFPLILSLGIKFGLITVDFLKEKRRIALLAVFILVSLLPPTDGLSLIAMGLPLIVLYEATILINRK